MLPGAGDGRQASHGMHGRRAVARAGETKAQPQEAARGAAVEPGEIDDLLGREAGEGGRPIRRLVGEMGLDLGAEIGVAREIVAVGEALLQQDMHHRQRQRAVAARPQDQRNVGRLDRRRAVDIDHRELGTALLARLGDVGHRIDLGRDGIAAPHNDQVGLCHLARIRPHQLADPGAPARFGRRHADGAVLAGIAEGMAQPVDAPALDHAHGAAGMIRPYGFTAVDLRRLDKGFGDLVEGSVPGDRPERTGALLPHPL